MLDTLKYIAPLTRKLLNAVLTDIQGTPAMNYPNIWRWVTTEFGRFKIIISINNKTMEMELSPMMHLKGHNLFGTNQPQPLLIGIMELIYGRFDIEFTLKDEAFYKQHDFVILRADITGGFNCESQADVIDTMELIRDHLLAHGHDIVVHEGPEGIETIYLGKHSSRSSLKFYNKYIQILAKYGQSSKELPHFPELLAYAENQLRYEFTHRTESVNAHGLNTSRAWSVSKVREILETKLIKLGFSGQMVAELPEDVAAGLNTDKLRKYRMWIDDIDMLNYYSPETVERDRKFFHEHGLDISRTHAQAQDSVVLSNRLSVDKLRMTYPKRFVDLGAVYK